MSENLVGSGKLGMADGMGAEGVRGGTERVLGLWWTERGEVWVE